MKVHVKHWLPTNGRFLNACVGGFSDQAMTLEVHGIEN